MAHETQRALAHEQTQTLELAQRIARQREILLLGQRRLPPALQEQEEEKRSGEDTVAQDIAQQLAQFGGIGHVQVDPRSSAPDYFLVVIPECGSMFSNLLSVRACQAALKYNSPAKTVAEACSDEGFRSYIRDCVATVNQDLVEQGYVSILCIYISYMSMMSLYCVCI
jgi:hypothetical protein